MKYDKQHDNSSYMHIDYVMAIFIFNLFRMANEFKAINNIPFQLWISFHIVAYICIVCRICCFYSNYILCGWDVKETMFLYPFFAFQFCWRKFLSIFYHVRKIGEKHNFFCVSAIDRSHIYCTEVMSSRLRSVQFLLLIF